MSRRLDDLYFRWLCARIADDTEVRWYKNLLKQLFTTEFDPFFPNDDNRAADGQYLRVEFLEDLGDDICDPHWMELQCSMLELFLGLAKRLAFQTGEPENIWFWKLIDNLDLRHTNRRPYPADDVGEVLHRVIHRKYKSDGRGGLFPLRRPDCDQRTVDLWYQLNAYLLENY